MKQDSANTDGLCPGVSEIRTITSRIYGIRVRRHLLPRVKNVKGLMRANPSSDLFCVEVSAMDNSREAALKRFQDIVSAAGLGMYFGART
ncbi:MAG: hypothetical protein WC728_02500 [Elusimicrobiota bacterium]